MTAVPKMRVKSKYDIDERILDCIFRKNQLSPPVCQCKNNHLACQLCCKTRTHGQCPKCSQPIGRTRKAIEEMLAPLRMPCKHGCRRMLTTSTKKLHEHYECEYLLLSCPFPGCKFKGSLRKYSSHVDLEHNNPRVILHNADKELLTFGAFHVNSREDVVLKACPELFLLHQEDTDLGHMLYLTCCGRDKRYSMEVVIANEYGKPLKTFKADIMTSNGRASGLIDFLLIPNQHVGSSTRHPLMARCTIFIPQF